MEVRIGDVLGALKRGLASDRRPPDGKLHCSSDILGSLRHAQLRLAGAPTIESELVGDIRLRTGTMWHDYIRDLMVREGFAVMTEVRLDKYLPEGWSGTADWLFWDFEGRCFDLQDLKTIRGEGMYYVEKEGVKPDHAAQLSAYYHALVASKAPVRKKLTVCYLPMNPDSDKRVENVEPVLVEFVPLDKDELWGLMEDKWAKCQEYLEWYENGELNMSMKTYGDHNRWLNAKIAPPTPRQQKLFWDKTNTRWDLKLVPDWRARYCPFPNELCDCSEQGTTKIGHYMNTDNGIQYVPRKDFENVFPLRDLTTDEIGRLRAAA